MGVSKILSCFLCQRKYKYLNNTMYASYLSVCQPEHRSQLFSVWLGDILLYFKSLLESFPLQVWKHRPRPWPFPLVRLWHCVFCEDGIRTWKTRQGHEVKKQRESKGKSCRCHTHTSKHRGGQAGDLCVIVLYVMTTWEGVLKLMRAWLSAAAAAA